MSYFSYLVYLPTL